MDKFLENLTEEFQQEMYAKTIKYQKNMVLKLEQVVMQPGTMKQTLLNMLLCKLFHNLDMVH